MKGLISAIIECILCEKGGKRVELRACKERRLNISVRISIEVHWKEMNELLSKDKDQL